MLRREGADSNNESLVGHDGKAHVVFKDVLELDAQGASRKPLERGDEKPIFIGCEGVEEQERGEYSALDAEDDMSRIFGLYREPNTLEL